MLIAIDESGSFVRSQEEGAWSVVAAYTFTERRKTKNLQAISRLKNSYKRAKRQEIKLRDLNEGDYFKFLSSLKSAGGALFAVATDGLLANVSEVDRHKRIQAEKIRINVPRMKFDGGKIAVSTLANEIESLSAQLYIQLVCQVTLLDDVLRRANLFYVQRDPVTLRRYVWRIDQKNTEKSKFEIAFEKIAPGLLQSKSFEKPAIFLEGADYSYFQRFRRPVEEYPEYLQKEYGMQPEQTIDVGTIVRENIAFPDSKNDLSVQIADLLAAGLRRCLRGGFNDNSTASKLLGSLMVQNLKPNPPILLVHLSSQDSIRPDKVAYNSMQLFMRYAQPMVL